MNITIERLSEIENERNETMSDPSFRQWMKDMGVGCLYRNPEPKYNARAMNSQYDFSKLFFLSKLESYIQVLIK